MITTLIVGSIVIPTEAVPEFDQRYVDLAGQTFRRTADGSGVLRSGWSGKISTRISGRGWTPSGLDTIALGSTHTIKCAQPRAVSSATTSVTLPVARRSDTGHTPIGFALVGDLLVSTAITGIVSNVATLTSVTGASGYRVHFWPEITAVILANECTGTHQAEFRWSIEAEEV
jgi:hypothetical protein